MKLIVRETDYHGTGEVILANDEGAIIAEVSYCYEDNTTSTISEICAKLGEALNINTFFINDDDINKILATSTTLTPLTPEGEYDDE